MADQRRLRSRFSSSKVPTCQAPRETDGLSHVDFIDEQRIRCHGFVVMVVVVNLCHRRNDDSQGMRQRHICLECLSERGSIATPLQLTLSSAQVTIVVIIINTPKQAQHNIEHRTAKLR
jgi:hypothetical protein